MEDSQLHIVHSWKTRFVEDNHEHCVSKLKEHETWKQVHFYSAPHSHHYSNGQLVRIQGMIQDMHNPEFYMSKYTVRNKVTGTRQMHSGKYKDVLQVESDEEIEFHDDREFSKERQSLFCIPIPALNEWVKDLHKQNLVLPESKEGSDADRRGLKRSAEENEDENMDVEDSAGKNKKQETEKAAGGGQATTTLESIQNFSFPIQDCEGHSFILKVYDSEDSIKLNSMVEVVGFLSTDPALTCLDGGEMDNDRNAEHPPPSLVPRLHVLGINILEHCNPLLPSFNFKTEAQKAFELANDVLLDLRIIFTPLLFGDKLAVDFFICFLLSKVFARKDVTNVGNLSVNFHELPNLTDYTTRFYQILEKIVTKSHYFPLTIEGLNSKPFTPKKDYTSNKLRSGLLQMSQGTLLVFDETKLNVGQLQDLGTRNVLALRGLLERQEVLYDFQYYNTPFHTDLPILIFSEKKSLFPCDARIPLECDPEALKVINSSFEAANLYLKKEEVLTRIRTFLTAAQLADYEIADEAQTKIQEHFVEMRQKDKNFTGDDLHMILNLARLVTLSSGQHVLTVEIWKQACDMEGARRARL